MNRILTSLLLLVGLNANAQRFVSSVSSIAQLLAYPANNVNTNVYVSGYYEANDGGGGTFRWNSASTAATNLGTIFKSPLISASSAGRWERVYSEPVNVRWFGAKGDGTTDDSVSVNNAISQNQSVYIPMGKYVLDNITVSGRTNACTIFGDGNEKAWNGNTTTNQGVNSANLISSGVTVLIQKSSSNPMFNLLATNVASGLVFQNLVFFQSHANYSIPTAYQPVFTDANSGASYWSGLTFRDLMFLNVYDGINLVKSERVDIQNVFGDFFHSGVFGRNWADVSKIERFEAWDFSNSRDVLAFRRGTNSSFAISLLNCDEVFVSDILIWDRCFGIYTSNSWTSIQNTTLDSLPVPLVIESPKNLLQHFSGLKINCESDTVKCTNAIAIIGSNNNSTSDAIFNGVAIWKGGKTNGLSNAVYINNPYVNVILTDFDIKYSATNGIMIVNASTVTLDNWLFSNYFPNQDSTNTFMLTTVGIRNESPTAILTIGSVVPSALVNVFDGYVDHATFPDSSSIIGMYPRIGKFTGTIVSDIADGRRRAKFTDTDASASFTGIRVLSTWNQPFLSSQSYMVGCVYSNAAAIANTVADHRFVDFPNPSGSGLYIAIPLNTNACLATRCSIQRFDNTASGNPTTDSAFGRTINGATTIYGVFVSPSFKLVFPKQQAVYKILAAPTESNNYWQVGDYFTIETPVAGGSIGFVCTTSGTPGTWKTYGAIAP